MEAIDISYKKFEVFLRSLRAFEGVIGSEQDVRTKIINSIFLEILCWPTETLNEEASILNGFIDYKFSIQGHSRLIVEAKKDDKDFEFQNRNSGKAYLLNGAVFSTKEVSSAINQAIRYSGQMNTELACVTNGYEWGVFRGSRLGDGIDTLNGMCFVFKSPEDILQNYALFYDLLAYESVAKYKYRAHFQEAEGQPIRSHIFKQPVRAPGTQRLIQTEPLAKDLERVMISFFKRLTGDTDPKFIEDCFVVTKESQLAERKIARISEDLISKIKEIGTQKGEELSELIRRAKIMNRNEFVVIVGTKGAGKSTFIDRFFNLIFPADLRESCVIIKVNLGDSEGDEIKIVEWLNQHLLASSEKAVFENAAPEYNDLQGMFFDEYTRWKNGTYKHLYEKDKEQFKIEFGKHIEQRRETRPHEYIGRILDSVVRVRHKMPIIVFDNADHFSIEFQQKVFQYARSIYENHLCLILLPITDRTSWQLSQQGAFQSFENESLYLPTPEPKTILETRINYIERKIEEEKSGQDSNYFLRRGISLSIENIAAFTACLQRVFLRTGHVATWIGNLSNNDIRRCLELASEVMSSPYLRVTELLKAYITNTSMVLKDNHIKNAIVKGRYDIYPVGQNKFTQNIFSFNSEIDTTPLLGMRILQLLADAHRSKGDGSDSFISINQIFSYFQAMRIDTRAMSLHLDTILKTGLCMSYDPTVTEISETDKVEISPSGLQHLYWGAVDSAYISFMSIVTPILNKDVFQLIHELRDTSSQNGWNDRLRIFIDYLVEEDISYCSIPEHVSYDGQRKIIRVMERHVERLRYN